MLQEDYIFSFDDATATITIVDNANTNINTNTDTSDEINNDNKDLMSQSGEIPTTQIQSERKRCTNKKRRTKEKRLACNECMGRSR